MDQLTKIYTGSAVLLNDNPNATLAILVTLNGSYWQDKIDFIKEGEGNYLLWKYQKPFCWITLPHYIAFSHHIPFIEASEIAYNHNIKFTQN